MVTVYVTALGFKDIYLLIAGIFGIGIGIANAIIKGTEAVCWRNIFGFQRQCRRCSTLGGIRNSRQLGCNRRSILLLFLFRSGILEAAKVVLVDVVAVFVFLVIIARSSILGLTLVLLLLFFSRRSDKGRELIQGWIGGGYRRLFRGDYVRCCLGVICAGIRIGFDLFGLGDRDICAGRRELIQRWIGRGCRRLFRGDCVRCFGIICAGIRIGFFCIHLFAWKCAELITITSSSCGKCFDLFGLRDRNICAGRLSLILVGIGVAVNMAWRIFAMAAAAAGCRVAKATKAAKVLCRIGTVRKGRKGSISRTTTDGCEWIGGHWWGDRFFRRLHGLLGARYGRWRCVRRKLRGRWTVVIIFRSTPDMIMICGIFWNTCISIIISTGIIISIGTDRDWRWW